VQALEHLRQPAVRVEAVLAEEGGVLAVEQAEVLHLA
jgi:hypothetical protein